MRSRSCACHACFQADFPRRCDARDLCAVAGRALAPLVLAALAPEPRERILEVFYSFQPVKHLWISPDFQYIQNPGYNRDRGPAKFYGVRFHTEF